MKFWYFFRNQQGLNLHSSTSPAGSQINRPPSTELSLRQQRPRKPHAWWSQWSRAYCRQVSAPCAQVSRPWGVKYFTNSIRSLPSYPNITIVPTTALSELAQSDASVGSPGELDDASSETLTGPLSINHNIANDLRNYPAQSRAPAGGGPVLAVRLPDSLHPCRRTYFSVFFLKNN